MMRKCLFLLFTSLFLYGCASNHLSMKKPPRNAPSDDASIKLAEAANSVSSSLIELARIEKESKPSRFPKNLINVTTYNLEARASLDWSGPVEELVVRLANASFYKTRILGHAPAVPVLVNISANDRSLADILRDVDYQIGNQADLKVFPKSKIIELRYAKV